MSTRTSFESSDLYEGLHDLESYLGYLRGNELAWDYLDDLKEQAVSRVGTGPRLQIFSAESPLRINCPSPRFGFYAEWTLDWSVPTDEYLDTDQFEREIQANVDRAYQRGVSWAQGIAGYTGSVCDRFTQPDVETLNQAILSMQTSAIVPLKDVAVADNWTGLDGLDNQWTGRFASAFRGFNLAFSDLMAFYAQIMTSVNGGFIAANGLIAATQNGALKFVHEMRDAVVQQLDQWVSWQQKPPDPSDVSPWIANIASVAGSLYKIAETLPIASTVVHAVDTVKSVVAKGETIAGEVKNLTDVDLMPHTKEVLPVETAEDLYHTLADTLHDRYYRAFEQGMDRLDSGRRTSGTPVEDADKESFSGSALAERIRSLTASDQYGGRGPAVIPSVRPTSLRFGGDDDQDPDRY